jgi:hypothetical protein
MQSLRNLLSRVVTRRYAQVHDITIKADNRILGSMERNGELCPQIAWVLRRWDGV